jgi:hypothetical protein
VDGGVALLVQIDDLGLEGSVDEVAVVCLVVDSLSVYFGPPGTCST